MIKRKCQFTFHPDNERCLDCGEDTPELAAKCQKKYRPTIEVSGMPEFSADEVNLIKTLSTKNEYYYKAYNFLIKYLDGRKLVSDKEINWIWGIKRDCESQMKS